MEETLLQGSPTVLRGSPTLRDIVVPVFRHRRLVVLSFLGIFLGALCSALVLPKQYEAEMKILVKHARIDPVVTSDRSGLPMFSASVSEEELNSEVELLKSRDLLQKVVLACSLNQPARGSFLSSVFAFAQPDQADNTFAEGQAVPKAVRQLEKKLEVNPLKKTNLISVKYESTDPQLAAHVLSTLATLYLEKHTAVHRPAGAFDFFQQETQRYKKELDQTEIRLADFSREEGVVSAQLETQSALEKLAEFEGTLRGTEAAIAETQKRMHELEAQIATSTPRVISQIRTADNPMLLQQLESTLLNLELKHTELLEKFDPSYQPVQEVEKQIAQARAAVAAAWRTPVREETTDRDPTYDWLRGELTKSQTEVASLRARAAATARVVRTYREQAASIDQKGTFQADLERAAKTAEENYLLYLHKREEARIADALDQQRIVNVAIAEAATVPALPSRPRWSWTLLLGGLLAGFVSLGLAYTKDYFDPSLRTPDEVQAELGIPVLAAFPRRQV